MNETKNELTTYEYTNNGIFFKYFVGYEIASLLGYKNPGEVIKKNVSKCNQLVFRDYPGVKKPELDPRNILITAEGSIEILLKTRKRISPDVLHILKKFNINTTNKKCLTKEQHIQNLEEQLKNLEEKLKKEDQKEDQKEVEVEVEEEELKEEELKEEELKEEELEEEELEEEKNELTIYEYISNGLFFEYFVGYEITSLLGYKNVAQTISNVVSKSNTLVFKDYPGIKIPKLDHKTILITRDGAIEILLKTRKRISPDVLHILKKFNINTTNKKCLTKEQQTLSAITNTFKTEKFEDQYKIGKYYLDLYFPEYKIVVECDENGHADRKPYNERERMNFVNKKLNIDDSNWISFNPDEYDFDVSKVIGRIYRKIKDEFKEINIPSEFEKYSKKSVNQYSLQGKFIKTFESIKIASIETNINEINIYRVCYGNAKSAGKYLWKFNDNNTDDIKSLFYSHKKCVAQYTLEGNLIKVYTSIVQAAIENKGFQSKAEISRACNGELLSSQGYMWRNVVDNKVLENIEPYVRHNEKKIHVYKDDILIGSFYNISEAAREIKRSRSAISRYIAGTTIDKSGYIWKDISKSVLTEISNPINAKTVFCYNKDNVLINSYHSVYNASNLTGKDRTTINRYIRDGKDDKCNIWKKIIIKRE